MGGTASLETGRWAEGQALEYLQRQGLRLVRRNFRCRLGEIDLVMRHGATLVFVEVRYRAPSRFGNGAESVTPAKQRRLLAAARVYLAATAPTRAPCRFDVVSVSKRHYEPEFHWVRDAFGHDG